MATATINLGTSPQLETDKPVHPYISLKRLPEPDVSTGSSTGNVFLQAQRPKLGYLPDDQIFQEREARLASLGDLDTDDAPPAGFSQRVDGPRVWSGKDFRDEDSYAVHLTPSDVMEVEAALQSFKSTQQLNLDLKVYN